MTGQQQNTNVIAATTFAEIDNFKTEWNNLSESVSPHFPSCSHAFISSYLRYSLNDGEKWIVYFAFNGPDRLVGVLPLIIHQFTRYGMTQHALQTPSNPDTYGVSALLSLGLETETFNSILAAAWQSHPSIKYIEISDVPQNLPLEQFSNNKYNLIISTRIGRYIKTNGSFSNYYSSLSKNFRSNQRKAENKLSKLSDVSYEFQTGINANSDRLSEFMQIEASNWKGKSGTAICKSDKMTKFYQYIADEFSGENWLEWHALKAEGKTIAMNFAVRFHQKIFLFKLGYDESKSRCSPGGMLLQKLLQQAFDDDTINEVDIITNAKWYDNWNMLERRYHKIRFYNPKNSSSILFSYIPDRLTIAARKIKFLRKLVHALKIILRKF